MRRYVLLLLIPFVLNAANAQVPAYRRFPGVEQSVTLPSGIKLHYVEQGQKGSVPVILLHGFTDSWHSYEMVLSNLPQDMHVFAITQRGHGNSDKPEGAYHPKDLATDLAAFMQEKHIAAAFIAGHSMGGMIAQQFALDYPQLTKGLIIIGSDASFRDNPGVPEFSAEINKLSDPVNEEFANAFQQSTCAYPIDPAYFKLLVNESLKLPARVWKAVMNGMMDTDLTARLHEIKQPVLILWGSKDGFCTRADQDRMMKEIAQAKLIVYEDTGHSMHWEQPKKFATDLTTFVKEQQQ